MTTLTEFHLFPFLPWEMRNRIWELAVRPLDRPSAHVFDVDCVMLDEERPEEGVSYSQLRDKRYQFDTKQKEKDKQERRLALKEGDIWVSPIRQDCFSINWVSIDRGYISDTYQYHLLSARVPAATLPAPGVAGSNPSVYMVDGGLWTACKQSREVMKKAFNSDKWDKLRMNHKQFEWRSVRGSDSTFGEGLPYAGLSREGISKMASTFYTSSSLPSSSTSSSGSTTITGTTTNPKEDNSNVASPTTILGKRYFTVLPHQDLFIFRLSTGVMTSSWDELFWDTLAEKLPLCAQHNGFLGLTNFAIEFNPAWGQSDAYQSLDKCPQVTNMTKATEALGVLHDRNYYGKTGIERHDCVLWFIDYRLVPKPKAGTASTIITTPIISDTWGTASCSSQMVFHDGNGGRYVPVEEWTMDFLDFIEQTYASAEEYFYPEGSLKPIKYDDGGEYTDSCRNFICKALYPCWFDTHEEYMDRGSGTPPEQQMPWAAQWGILAYLPPGTEEGTGIHTS